MPHDYKYELHDSDLPGTAFLLRAEGRVRYGDGLNLARTMHQNKVIDRHRSEQRHRITSLSSGDAKGKDDIDLPGRLPDPAAAVETRDLLARIVARLTPLQRRILAALAEGESLRSFARAEGLNRGTVRLAWLAAVKIAKSVAKED